MRLMIANVLTVAFIFLALLVVGTVSYYLGPRFRQRKGFILPSLAASAFAAVILVNLFLPQTAESFLFIIPLFLVTGIGCELGARRVPSSLSRGSSSSANGSDEQE
jgi:hypothetical protein